MSKGFANRKASQNRRVAIDDHSIPGFTLLLYKSREFRIVPQDGSSASRLLDHRKPADMEELRLSYPKVMEFFFKEGLRNCPSVALDNGYSVVNMAGHPVRRTPNGDYHLDDFAAAVGVSPEQILKDLKDL
jgi:hypothetical protein